MNTLWCPWHLPPSSITYHFHDWRSSESQGIIHASRLQSDTNDERGSLNMNASFRLPSRPSAARIVFVKTNWQDPYLHKRSTKDWGLPVDDWNVALHRRGGNIYLFIFKKQLIWRGEERSVSRRRPVPAFHCSTHAC